MTVAPDQFDDDEHVLPVPLDRETRAWLIDLARVTGDHPRRIVASLLHDLRKDDQAAHRRLN